MDKLADVSSHASDTSDASVAPPEASAVLALLSRVESDVHRDGWDGDPCVFVAYDGEDRETVHVYQHLFEPYGWPVRVGPLMARAMMPLAGLRPRPAQALFRAATNVSLAVTAAAAPELLEGFDGRAAGLLASTARMVDVWRQPGFLGVGMVTEAWIGTRKSVEELEAFERSRVSLADVPGSREARWLQFVDRFDRQFSVSRYRGDKPVCRVEGLEGGGGRSAGCVVESLRVLVAVMAGLPVPELTTAPFGWDVAAERERADGAKASRAAAGDGPGSSGSSGDSGGGPAGAGADMMWRER